MALGHRERPIAALVGLARPGTGARGLPSLEEAAPVLTAVLERDLVLAANTASERALVQSSERKLTRLGFDLHDGPLQEVTVLGSDLREFREQLERVIGPLRKHASLNERLEDLGGQLRAVDAELRRLANEVQAASVLLDRPFHVAVRDRIQTFAARTGVAPRLRLDGDLSLVSTSQQIALLNIIHEALTNVRDHAQATRVEVTVSVTDDGVEARVYDNGRGFDLESALVNAARRGRVGLVAMNERVRLLGGQCRIESQPGGPTIVWVALDRWLPIVEDARAIEARGPAPVSASAR